MESTIQVVGGLRSIQYVSLSISFSKKVVILKIFKKLSHVFTSHQDVFGLIKLID
jgi:phosphoribosylformimino-5-aminoimidazole carboxamide ribonucleotide (ProFAR) isomerase